MKLKLLLVFTIWIPSLTAQTLPPRKLLACGSFEAKTRQVVYLHRQAKKRALEGTLPVRAPGKRKRQFAANTPTGFTADGEPANAIFLPMNPFDLENRSLAFSPEQASAASYTYAAAPTAYDAARTEFPALRLPVSDDDAFRVSLPFPFPFFGKVYQEIWVNTNGHLTFERPDPDYRNLTLSAFELGPPRISPIMADFFPDFSYDTVGIFQFTSPTSVTFTWKNVPLFDSLFDPELDPISLQVELHADGTIRFHYQAVEEGAYLVGLSPGGDVAEQATFVDFTVPSATAHPIGVFEVYSDFPELDIVEATRQFYTFYSQRKGVSLNRSDVADVLVFFTDFPGPATPGAIAYNVPVRNSVKGIGLDQFDFGEDFGSPQRLKAVINMGSTYQYPYDTDEVIPGFEDSGDTLLTIFAHEFAHMFLAYPRIKQGDRVSRVLIGRQDAHWSFNFNSDGSVLEGNRIELLESGDPARFQTTGTSHRYSELDLYLMGFAPPESVGVSQELFYIDESTRPSTDPTRKGVVFQGKKVPFLFEDLLAAEGPRHPDHIASQKKYNVVVVWVDRDGISGYWDKGEEYGLGRGPSFGEFLDELTGVEGTVAGYPGTGIQPQPFAGIALGKDTEFRYFESSSSGTIIAGPWPHNRLEIESDGGILEHPARVDREVGSSVFFAPVKAVQEGFGKLRIAYSWNGTSPITEETGVRVLDESKLHLQIVSGNRQQVGAGATTPNSITIRVVDDLGIPYRGVSVSAEATSGGQIYPSPQISSEFGEVRFQWTTGDAPENSAAVFITSNRATTTIPLQTVLSKSIVASAATNGASFITGITPGSLATLFGVNLSAGAEAEAQSLPLPLTLGGVGLRINGDRVPLLYVGLGQINFLVPQNVAGETADVEVRSPDGVSEKLTVPVLPAAPGIFFDPGTNLGAILPAGTGQKTNNRPAKPGEFVEIFATGLGAVVPSPDVPDLFLTLLTPVLFVDGVEIPVSFSGLAPGFVGLNQLNAKLPDTLAPGRHDMKIVMNGVESNTAFFFSE